MVAPDPLQLGVNSEGAEVCSEECFLELDSCPWRPRDLLKAQMRAPRLTEAELLKSFQLRNFMDLRSFGTLGAHKVRHTRGAVPA